MNKNIRKYLVDAQSQANQNVMSANGEYFGADGYIDRAVGFTNDLNPGAFYPADGQQAAPATESQAQPIIITVSNASATQINNFPIWGAQIYLDTTRFSWANGNLTISGVTLSLTSGNAAIQTYYTALQQSMTNNFTVGKTYLSVLTGSNAQVIQPISINTYDVNGNQAGKLLPSPLSPNQYQAGVLINEFAYRIDGNTTFSINVLANMVFQIYFYPSYNINLARGLGDNAIGRQFAAPTIGSPAPVKMVN